jgi:ribosomal protein S18 acetylase RimI-like enzyme
MSKKNAMSINPQDTLVRIATGNDAVAISNLWKSLSTISPYLIFEVDEIPGVMQLTRTLDSSNQDIIIVAVRRKELVGYLAIRVGILRRVRGVGVLAMGVLSEHRRTGIGSKLILEATKISLERGLHRLELRVDQENSEAISLYRHHGFIEEGIAQMSAQVDGRFVDKIHMAKLIGIN